jgi:hypothetical protein
MRVQTKADVDITEEDDRITVRYSEEIRRLAREERDREGYKSVSTVYQKALKFYFDNKDNPAFMDPGQLDSVIETKMDELLSDPNRVERLRKMILRP